MAFRPNFAASSVVSTDPGPANAPVPPAATVTLIAASSHADHITPFIKADGTVSWVLFSDVNNLRGLCAPCHDRATATFDGGFGNIRKEGKTDYVAPTGGAGRQFTSSSVSVQKVDALIPTSDEDIASLLEGIPDL